MMNEIPSHRFCVDCKWHRKKGDVHLCFHIKHSTRNYVTGKIKHEECFRARSELHNGCGIPGRYFQKDK